MLGPKDIQQECRETTQRSQEAEGSNDPQEQHRLRIHAEICRENQIFRAPSKKSPLAGGEGGVCPLLPKFWGARESWTEQSQLLLLADPQRR